MKYLLGNLCVYTGEGTVKQVYICLRVESPSQRNPCLFALGQGHSFLSYYCEISFWKFLEIIGETGCLDDFHVKFLVKLFPKGDIVTDTLWKYHGLLVDIGHLAIVFDVAWVVGHLSEDSAENAGFSWVDFPAKAVYFGWMEGKGEIFEGRFSNILDPKATEISKPNLSFPDLPFHVFGRPDLGKRFVEELYGVDVLRGTNYVFVGIHIFVALGIAWLL